MADNESLHGAKKAKNDEFYTLYPDIEAEMNAYIEYKHDVFRDKTLLLPCDDPALSLKELVSTGKDIIAIIRNNIFTHMNINFVCALGGVA